MIYRTFLIACVMSIVSSYKDFQRKFPNGDKVPHPCPNFAGYVWEGVGHLYPAGSGARNPFGIDFEINNFEWTECLCRYDSDGDGRTNGEELGDPLCTWSEGDEIYAAKDTLSHPGICEPIDDPKCMNKNDWLDCEYYEEHVCPDFNNTDTQVLELTIARTLIPPQDTSYVCTAFSLPDEMKVRDYHIIGAEAVIDNHAIMHHILVYGCIDERAHLVEELYRNTSVCSNIVHYCPNLVYLWTFGLEKDCATEDYGYHIGASGYKTLVMEFHWNNPYELENQYDASGVKLYYTENLRQFDAQNFFAGPQWLEIPPHQERHVESGYCLRGCMEEMFSGHVYVSKVGPHMHLLGRSILVELVTAEGEERVLANQTRFDYNYPKWVRYDPPFAMKNTDSIRVTCWFDTTHINEWTYFGEGTLDEMCLAVIEYFPKHATDTSDCLSFGSKVAFCHGSLGDEIYRTCRDYSDDPQNAPLFDEMHQYLLQHCDPTGWTCLPGCQDAITMVKNQHTPCFNDDVIQRSKFSIFRRVFSDKNEMLRLMASCDGYNITQPEVASDVTSPLEEWCAAENLTSSAVANVAMGVTTLWITNAVVVLLLSCLF